MDSMNREKLLIFDDQTIRTAWDEENEEWYFSIVDVVGVLTEQPDIDGARNYWKVLKNRLSKEGSQLVTNCNQLKMRAQDGKRRLTDVANTEQLLRLIQSIPSKKAEPFKLWPSRYYIAKCQASRTYCEWDDRRNNRSGK